MYILILEHYGRFVPVIDDVELMMLAALIRGRSPCEMPVEVSQTGQLVFTADDGKIAFSVYKGLDCGLYILRHLNSLTQRFDDDTFVPPPYPPMPIT